MVYKIQNTLEDLIKQFTNYITQLHGMKKLFSGQIKEWYNWYLTRGINHYAINSILFLTTVREKYVKINQFKQYAQAIRVFSKGYLPISLLSPSKLNIILEKVKQTVQIKNKDYDLVIKRLYLYYDIKLVTFGIDDQREFDNSIPILCSSTRTTAFHIIPTGDSASSNCRQE